MNITITIEAIGPAQAQKLLARMITPQRKLNGAAVARYAEDMANGKWIATGEPIQIDDRDTTLNGQHRLHAIIESGETVDIAIARGVPRVAINALDSGVARSNSMRLEVSGDLAGKKRVGAINCLRALHENSLRIRSMSFQSLLAFDRAHRDAIDFALVYPDRIEPGYSSGGSAARAAFAHAHMCCRTAADRTKLEKLRDSLIKNDGLSDAARLIQSAVAQSHGTTDKHRFILACTVLRGIELQMSGTTLSRLSVSIQNRSVLDRMTRGDV